MDTHSGRSWARRFSLGDVLILVGALAMALWLLRADRRVAGIPQLPHRWSALYSLPTDARLPFGATKGGLVRNEAGRELKILVRTFTPVLWALTVAQISMRLLRPRPPVEQVIRQAGFVACVAATVGYLGLWDLSCTREDYYVCSRCADPVPPPWSLQESALILLWFVLGLKPWCKEPTWIDRLGRAVGLGWVLAMASEMAAYQLSPLY
jgi:hypothetical protein